jgi:hypothetical protein
MLDANELRGIPSGLFGMVNLAKLSLKHNYITGVPSRIAELSSLQELYLNNNKITKVPIHVYRLPKLRCVLLSGNPMDLNAKTKKSSGSGAAKSGESATRTPWDALGARRIEEKSDDTNDGAAHSAPVHHHQPHHHHNPHGGSSNNNAQSSMNTSGSLSTSGTSAPPPKRPSVPVFVPNREVSDSEESESSSAPLPPPGSSSSTTVSALAAGKGGHDSDDTSDENAASLPPIDISAAKRTPPRTPASASSSPMLVDKAASAAAKRSLASKIGGMFRKKSKSDSAPDTPVSASAAATSSPALLTSSPPPGSSATSPPTPALSPSSASAGWLNGSTQVAREAAEKFDREHGVAPLSPIAVEPLGGDAAAASKPKKKRKQVVDVPPPVPQRGKSETPAPPKSLLSEEKATRRRSTKLAKRSAAPPAKPKAFTLKAGQVGGESGAGKALTLSASPQRSAKLDELLKAHKTPRVRPLEAVRPVPKPQKSRFFMELRQDNDSALMQVALEETDDTIFVQSAPVHALVLLLSHAWGFDAKFQSQFVASMRAFVQPLELLDMLQQRYEAHLPSPSEASRSGERTAVRERILSFLDEWLSTMPSEIVANRVLRKNLLDFLRGASRAELQHRQQSTLAERADKLQHYMRAFMQAESAARERAHDEQKAAPLGARPLLGDTVPTTLGHGSSATPSPRGASASTSTVDPSDPPPTPHLPASNDAQTLSLLDLHPIEIARQLTLIDHELLRRTRLGEWFDCSWTGDAAREDAPTIVALVNHFNSVGRWVSTAIVSAADVDSRVVLLKRFLIAAHACAELRNLNGVMQILSGVEAFAVHRLRKTWAALPKQSHKLYEELCELVAIDDGDLAGFRQRMAQCALPCLPYVGPYLANLQQLDESSLTFSETGDVNFEKLAAKADVVLELKSYMDVRFNLAPVAVVQQFLRTQPLKSDDELTKLSLVAEPLSGK